MKALTRGDSLYLSISGRHRSHYLWLLTQLYSAIPKNLRRQAKVIFVWYVKERADLKMMHDENDVLIDDELVVARSFLHKSKHACLYIQNEYPRGFRLLNHARGDYFKLAKYTHLMLSSYPKTSDVIEMVCQLGQFGPIVQILIRYLSHRQSLHLLWQSRHKRNTVIPSSADLTCFAMENILLLPHLKQVYNKFLRASCGFSGCLITRFIFSLAESKTGCSNIRFMFVPILFLCTLK